MVFFTMIEGLSDQTVTHRWTYNGKVMATATLGVKDDVDPVWSSNRMRPE